MKREGIEIKEKLLNALLWNDNEAVLGALEREAIQNDIFDEDNGDDIKRKAKESLGVYIERCNSELMKNFSRKKYELLKGLYTEYNNFGDSTIEMTETVAKRPTVTKKNIAIGVGVTAALVGVAGIFKKMKK